MGERKALDVVAHFLASLSHTGHSGFEGLTAALLYLSFIAVDIFLTMAQYRGALSSQEAELTLSRRGKSRGESTAGEILSVCYLRSVIRYGARHQDPL